jgi:hypothetical protein
VILFCPKIAPQHLPGGGLPAAGAKSYFGNLVSSDIEWGYPNERGYREQHGHIGKIRVILGLH